MGKDTKIQWAHHTFNPWRGCTKVSAGCANCYAETQSKRNLKVLGQWGPNGTRVVAAESTWREPLKWHRAAELAAQMFRAAGGDPERLGIIKYDGGTVTYERQRVFCASMADVFEDWQGPMVDSNNYPLVLETNGWHPENCESLESATGVTMNHVRRRLFDLIDATPYIDWLLLTKRPENIHKMMPNCDRLDHRIRENVWLGTSIEDQKTAEERIPHLLKVLAKVRFLSVEPLLGPVDLRKWRTLIDWVVVGGESGPGARPCQIEWIRDIVHQCKSTIPEIPVFVKQLGSNSLWNTIDGGISKRILDDPKGGNPDEWAEDLRVRELPEPT